MDSICHPETAWPDPAVIVAPENATAEQVALLALRVERAAALGWTTYRGLTGNTVSICPTTVRPIVSRHSGFPRWFGRVFDTTSYDAPFAPTIIDGQWLNIWCGGNELCGCDSLDSIKLPGGAGRIVSVTIDGVPLPETAYAVYNGGVLRRLDGEAWPVVQDWDKLSGEGVFEVTYWQGIAPDVLDFMAAGILAAEFLKALSDDKKCRLPSGATSIVRQGVSMQIEVDLFDKGLTGIREVDMATARRNPNRLRTAPRVLAPRSRRANAVTWRA